jgi:hypothetical protein
MYGRGGRLHVTARKRPVLGAGRQRAAGRARRRQRVVAGASGADARARLQAGRRPQADLAGRSLLRACARRGALIRALARAHVRAHAR